MKEDYEMKQEFMRGNMIPVASKQKEGYWEDGGVQLKEAGYSKGVGGKGQEGSSLILKDRALLCY